MEGTNRQPVVPGDGVRPKVYLPFAPLTLSRSVDHLHLRVDGHGVSLSGGRIVRTPGVAVASLSMTVSAPQHWCEPAVDPVSPGPPSPWLLAASPTVLDVDLQPGDQVDPTLTGILSLLQTHVLSDRTRLSLPTSVRLQPDRLVAADDVPVVPADPPSADGFRERWHLALRTVVPQGAASRVRWEREDTTRWRAVSVDQRKDDAAHPDLRPPGTLPTIDLLQDLVEQTNGSGPSLLEGTGLVLSGGGASGQLFGQWDEPAKLALYRERFVSGRTTYGMTVERGILYPFGLRASLVTTWQRELNGHTVAPDPTHPPDPVPPVDRKVGAYLVVSRKIVIRDLSRDLRPKKAAAGFASPFVAVEVVNPVRDGVPAVQPGSGDTERARPVPAIAYVVTDRAGVRHRLEVPGYFLAGDEHSGSGANGDPTKADLGRLETVYAPADGPPGEAPTPPASAQALRNGSNLISRAFLPTSGIRVAYTSPSGNEPGPGSELTSELRFRLGDAGAEGFPIARWWADPPPPEVDWFQADLSQVAQFTGSPVSTTMRYPRPGTTPGVLLELVEPVEVRLDAKGLSQAFCSPSFRSNAVSAKGSTFVPRTDAEHAAGAFLADTVPRLLGLFDLTKLLPDLTHGPAIEVRGPSRTLTYQTDLLTKTLTLDPSETLGHFLPALTVHEGRLELRSTVSPTATTSSTTVTGTSVDLGGLLTIPLERVTLVREGGHVRLSDDSEIRPPRLTGPFRLVSEVLDSLPPDLFGDGPTVRVTGSKVTAAILVDVPSVAFGAFSVRNLTVEVSVIFRLGGGGIGVKVSLGTLERPFQVGVGIFEGGGHVALRADWDGRQLVPSAEGSLELGAGVAVDLTLASGVVEAVAGLWIDANKDRVEVGGYVRLLGTVRVKYLGSMTVRTDLSLFFDGRCTVHGKGSYTIEIDVWLLSASVSIPFEYSFKTAKNDPPLLELLATSRGAETEWDDYWAAFDDTREPTS